MAEDNKVFEESEDFLKWAKKQQEDPDFYWKMCFDALHDPAFIISANGVILICNDSLENFLNMPENEIIGKKCHTLIYGTDDFPEGCPFVKSRDSEKREKFILKLSQRYYRMTVDPIFDRKNQFAGALHIILDVHDMLRTNAERAMMGKVIENTSDGVISTDLECRITEWNNGAERMFGYQNEEILGMNFKDLLHDSSEGILDEIVGNLRTGRETERKDVKFRTKSGELIDVSLGSSPVHDERDILNGAAFILTDHTRERKAEQNLLSFMAEAVLRLEKPLDMIKTNIGDAFDLYEKGEIDRDELKDLISIQILNAEKILENINGLKKSTADMGDIIPDIMKEFLRR